MYFFSAFFWCDQTLGSVHWTVFILFLIESQFESTYFTQKNRIFRECYWFASNLFQGIVSHYRRPRWLLCEWPENSQIQWNRSKPIWNRECIFCWLSKVIAQDLSDKCPKNEAKKKKKIPWLNNALRDSSSSQLPIGSRSAFSQRKLTANLSWKNSLDQC